MMNIFEDLETKVYLKSKTKTLQNIFIQLMNLKFKLTKKEIKFLRSIDPKKIDNILEEIVFASSKENILSLLILNELEEHTGVKGLNVINNFKNIKSIAKINGKQESLILQMKRKFYMTEREINQIESVYDNKKLDIALGLLIYSDSKEPILSILKKDK